MQQERLHEPQNCIDITVSGHSMYPRVLDGQKVRVQLYPYPQKLSSQRRGQIILARESGEWTLHRLVHHKNKKVLKGDWSECFTNSKDNIAWGVLLTDSELDSWATYLSELDFFLRIRPLVFIKKLLIWIHFKCTAKN